MIWARGRKKKEKNPQPTQPPTPQKTQPTPILSRREDFFVIIKIASTKAITQPDFYFDKWFGYYFFYYYYFYVMDL